MINIRRITVYVMINFYVIMNYVMS